MTPAHPRSGQDGGRTEERSVTVATGSVTLDGILGWPKDPRGIVVFAHGSGSGRFSPRNNFVARQLQGGGIATLLVDLLQEYEALDRHNVFDIALLSRRLLDITAWLRANAATQELAIGYFGASTGAGAALRAAALEPEQIAAVVSRGGRPDLAAPYLPKVTAPTLLIVGGLDDPVIEMNQEALALLTCRKELIIVPGASHLFEEPGTLEEVARLARHWFQKYLHPCGER
jgi:putative phosphoribosyl transferase